MYAAYTARSAPTGSLAVAAVLLCEEPMSLLSDLFVLLLPPALIDFFSNLCSVPADSFSVVYFAQDSLFAVSFVACFLFVVCSAAGFHSVVRTFESHFVVSIAAELFAAGRSAAVGFRSDESAC